MGIFSQQLPVVVDPNVALFSKSIYINMNSGGILLRDISAI
jgi:hypothetical protein